MATPPVSAVALFPWVALTEPITLGATRLLPYAVGTAPGKLQHATQADLDGVIGAYANRPGVRVPRATLLEIGDWFTGMDDTAVKPLLFRARAAIGFTALSKRRLFVGHLNYCSYDTYTLVVHRYKAGEPGMFSFTARRRDGSGLHIWDSDSFAFQRPRHVDERAEMDFDQPLARTLIDLLESGGDLYEALSEFNAANTDSQDVPPSIEVVMVNDHRLKPVASRIRLKPDVGRPCGRLRSP